MFDNELYNVPLDKVLVALGSQPGKEKDMWTSPLREETKPSLHINPAKPSSSKVAVFEGMFDFLSWRVMQSSEQPTCGVVILNSVNNLKRAADYIQSHDGVTCFLDNDAAGEKCYQDIRDLMKGKDVLDMSDLYGQYKDLNEMLQASRGYSLNMRLTE